MDWWTPDADWCVKLARADTHIQALRDLLAQYRSTEPYSLRPEPTADSDRSAIRLRIHRPPPIEASALVGDALHNIRSALDAAARAMTIHERRRTLTDDEAQWTGFPVTSTPERFRQWKEHGKRAPLLTAELIADFEVAQPWEHRLRYAAEYGSEPAEQELASSFTFSPLARLVALNDIDKHRHLTLMAWFPTLIWWGSNEGDPEFGVAPGDGTFSDDSIAYYVHGPYSALPDFHHDFVMALTDDPGHRAEGSDAREVTELLASMRQQVGLTFSEIEHRQRQRAE